MLPTCENFKVRLRIYERSFSKTFQDDRLLGEISISYVIHIQLFTEGPQLARILAREKFVQAEFVLVRYLACTDFLQ